MQMQDSPLNSSQAWSNHLDLEPITLIYADTDQDAERESIEDDLWVALTKLTQVCMPVVAISTEAASDPWHA